MVLQGEHGQLAVPYDEIHIFLQSKSVADKFIGLLNWWKFNEALIPIVAKTARDVLSIQATSVPSKSTLSIYVNVLSHSRLSLGEDYIISTISLRSWYTFVKE